LGVLSDWAQDGAEVLPVPGELWLHECEGIEDAHRVLVPSLRIQHGPEYFQCTWMMVICGEHAQTFVLCGRQLSAGDVLACEFQQDLWIERE